MLPLVITFILGYVMSHLLQVIAAAGFCTPFHINLSTVLKLNICLHTYVLYTSFRAVLSIRNNTEQVLYCPGISMKPMIQTMTTSVRKIFSLTTASRNPDMV